MPEAAVTEDTVPAPETARWPTVSVVIPTYRRDELLRRTLAGVCGQDYAGEREIIVVDDGRSPTTGGVIESVARDWPIIRLRLLEGKGRGPASARNVGWQAATGEVIAFIDDDAYPADRRWLAKGAGHFRDGATQVVTGRVRVPLPERPTDFQRNVGNLERASFLTCNAFCRRTALEAVGGFDERYEVPFREDSDLQFRLEARGARLIREPGAVVIHPAPPGRFAVSLRLQRYSMFNALIYRQHRGRYAELGAPTPWRYYAILGAAAVAIAALLSGRRRWAASFVGAWAVMEGRFFLHRVRTTSRSPRHLLDLAVTSLLIPPLSVYWRLRGAVRYRVLFL